MSAAFKSCAYKSLEKSPCALDDDETSKSQPAKPLASPIGSTKTAHPAKGLASKEWRQNIFYCKYRPTEH